MASRMRSHVARRKCDANLQQRKHGQQNYRVKAPVFHGIRSLKGSRKRTYGKAGGPGFHCTGSNRSPATSHTAALSPTVR